jgi:hypothetical protein
MNMEKFNDDFALNNVDLDFYPNKCMNDNYFEILCIIYNH